MNTNPNTITMTPEALAAIIAGLADTARPAADALALAATTAATAPAPEAPASPVTVTPATVAVGTTPPAPAAAPGWTVQPATVTLAAPTPYGAATDTGTLHGPNPAPVTVDPFAGHVRTKRAPAATPAAATAPRPRTPGGRRAPMHPEAAVIAVVKWARDTAGTGREWTMDDAIAGLDPIMGKHLTRTSVDTATERGWIMQANAPAKRNKRYTYPGTASHPAC